MAEPDECTHPVQMAGMCAVCGKELDNDALSQTSLSMMHSHAGVKVSEDEARRLDSETTAHLVSQRKLALIVDLDQTIIHATVDPTVGEWMRDENNPNFRALSDVGTFKLGVDGRAVSDVSVGEAARRSAQESANDDASAAAGCWYYVKPRPGLSAFLESLSQRYELHVYTMGTRSYADCVCKLVDPAGSIFGNRILSRDENGSLVQKSLSRLFPVDTSMVVIIDDRADVWKWSPNLVKVMPYDFFVGIGDINATFLPAAPVLPGAALPDAAKAAASVSPLPSSSPSAPSTSSSDAALAGNPSSTTTPLVGSATTPAASEEPKPTGATGDQEEPKPTKEAVALLAAQSQKLEDLITEQRQERPLAKMQEALNEKLGTATATSASASAGQTPPSSANSDAAQGGAGTATTNGKGKEKVEHGVDGDGSNDGNQKVAAASADEKSTAAAAATDSSGPESDNAASSASSASQQGSEANGLAPHPQAVLRDDDTELQRLQTILDDLHARWYADYDRRSCAKAESGDAQVQEKPNVTDLIADRKSKVLKDCFISFSGMIPNNVVPATADIWRVAEEYGAKCISNLTQSVTHVIAARSGTVKVLRAMTQPSISVVWPGWLHESIARWERQPERWYRLPALEGEARTAHADDGWDDPVDGEPGSAAAAESEDGEPIEGLAADAYGAEPGAMPGFGEMDWAEAADEVDQFLDDDSEADGESEAESDTAATRSDASGPSTPKKEKRSRTESGCSGVGGGGASDAEEDAEEDLLLRSPLSKRRKRTEDRMGKSKLKQSVTGEELVEQQSGDDDHSDEASVDAASAQPGSRAEGRVSSNGGGVRSRRMTPPGGEDAGMGTDTGSVDESFLDDLANEMELQMDADSDAASHSDDD
ncbi:CTD phosphatase Fcp1 [Thecaphora frezii]